MSRRFFIILISIILGLLLVSMVGYYFILQDNNPGDNGGIIDGFRSFLPFGGNDYTNDNPVNTIGNENPDLPNENIGANFTQKLRHLSLEPIAGAGILDVKAGSVVRYIEKATGHIYEVEMFSPNIGRISNTTIPLVYDAIWGDKNNSLIARYIEDDDQTIDTYSITLKDVSTTTESTISGTLFPENISDVSVLGNSVFYLQNGSNGSSGYISSFTGGNKKKIWDSPLKQLTSQYPNTNFVYLTTKPYQNVSGYMYSVNTNNGQVKKIIGDIAGLSTLVSNSGNYVFFISQTSSFNSFIYNTKDRTASEISPATIPEKCVWSKKEEGIIYCAVPREYLDGNSLTSWYKGYISFTDDIWKYDLNQNTSSIVTDLSRESNESIDVIKPIVSDNDQYLIFINKKDGTLWSLDLLAN